MSLNENSTTTDAAVETVEVQVVESKKAGKVKEALVEGTKLEQRTRNLADKIKQSVTEDETGNTGRASENVIPEFFEANGVPKATLERVVDLLDVVYPAAKLANAELGIEKMATDKDMTKYITNVPIVRDDYIYTSTTRSQVIGGRTVYGVTKLSHESHGQRGVGQMAVVRDIISERSNAALANV